MEKKQSSKRSSPHSKVFGTNALPLCEDDASRIVGRIMEKGISNAEPNNFSASVALPKPSVIPFPVARHRSHGPHWSPIGKKKKVDYLKDGDEKEDEYGEQDEFLPQFGQEAPFANPVPRKEKTGFDFSRWKEIIKVEESSKTDKVILNSKKADKLSNDKHFFDDAEKIDLPCQLSVANGAQISTAKDVLHSNSCWNTNEEFSNPVAIKMGEHHATSAMIPGSEASLDSQIDMENKTRIQSMSPAELSELLDEINEKINPSVLLALKKRGQNKLKNQKSSIVDVATHYQLGNLQKESTYDTKDLQNPNHDVLHETTMMTSKDATKMIENDMLKNFSQNVNNLWNAWSKRVEAVRLLRFSLEGEIIDNAAAQLLENDKVHVRSGYIVDTVNERDFLLTEGDPSAAGYSIIEAVTLTRSVIPGQRVLGLNIISNVLEKTLFNMHQTEVGCTMEKSDRSIDWEAIWAYSLGPEPELVLTLRLCVDDNHSSVVLACTKVVQCILSCDRNETFFVNLEKTPTYEKDLYTAPIFRSKAEIDGGFLQGGYWKYSAKASNILCSGKDFGNEEIEEKHTIQDDIVIAGQDFAAGLVRMGILPRLCYLLEAFAMHIPEFDEKRYSEMSTAFSSEFKMDPSVALEECIISILIAIVRHSPTCADAVMNCDRLVQTVIHRFTIIEDIKTHPSKIKSVCLLKVLARANRKHCLNFIENGSFHALTWHLYKYTSSVDQWIATGRDNCRVSSALFVEQLKFWKVCIQYGYCVSYFSDVFPALCIWLNPPTFEKLKNCNVLCEFASISSEAYRVLEALARRLPNFFKQDHLKNPPSNISGLEIWPWSCVVPMIDLALKWLMSKNDPFVSKFFEGQKDFHCDSIHKEISPAPLLMTYSASMRMLSRVLEKIFPKDCISPLQSGQSVPWLPEFVPKVGLELIKNGYLRFDSANDGKYSADSAGVRSFIEGLTIFWQQRELETSLASVCCLHELVQLTNSIDLLLQLANAGSNDVSTKDYSPSKEEKILKNEMIKVSFVEWRTVLTTVAKIVASDCHSLLSIETFGRGGPAPGVGIGWGASGEGYWSKRVLMSQTAARFLVVLLETFLSVLPMDTPPIEETFTVQCVNSALAVCLTLGPRDTIMIDKAFKFLLQDSILRYLDFCAHSFLRDNEKIKQFGWEYNKEDYSVIGKILASHFSERWLSVKKSKVINSEIIPNKKMFKEKVAGLETIYEDSDASSTIGHDSTSLVVEWSQQRLPLPSHWFLSPISTIRSYEKSGLQETSNIQDSGQESNNLVEVAKSGLFFLLGIEAMSTFLHDGIFSPVRSVPLIWKLHSMSVVLVIGMGVLEDAKTRSMYEALQDHFGRLLDGAYRSERSGLLLETRGRNSSVVYQSNNDVELLRFQSDIHGTYTSFVENLVEQFSAVSYGDPLYGRQVALYLHRRVDVPVRLFAWNALTNSRVLELLPPLINCIAEAEGYLQPIEDNEVILEAYVKSWISGALEKAATRGSISYIIALHHLSSYIFDFNSGDKLMLRNKLARSLLRDLSQKKQQQQEMMLELILYTNHTTKPMQKEKKWSPVELSIIEKRVGALKDACQLNSVLLSEVDKLKSCVMLRL